jgi:(p)ppGpp synthase/HD superfamily hydrolase
MKEWVAVLKAADAAARWHVHQRRKGAAQEPFVNHLFEVASLVAEATQAEEPDIVIAALLHDAIEDSEVPREIIAAAFGEHVARLVEELTNEWLAPKAQGNPQLRGTAYGVLQAWDEQEAAAKPERLHKPSCS